MAGRTRIKICGIDTPVNALAAVAAGADAIGLVFVEQSPRVVNLEQARAVLGVLPALVEPVGLFMDQPVREVVEVVQALGLRTVQLHGRETPEVAAALPEHVRVIKAIGFDAQAAAAMDAWQVVENLCAVLIDAPVEGGALSGGTGQTFDWQALAGWLVERDGQRLPPVILAGGLTAENVGQAIRTVRPYAVDVSSGVESQRGVKDAARIAAFCHAVRAAER